MSDFGERLYELRNKNNMSQGSLADRLDVSRQTVSKWENNLCMPEADKLIQLSEIFNVSTDHLLKGKETEVEPSYIYVKDSESNSDAHNRELIVRKYVGMVLAIVFSIITVIVLIMGGNILAVIPGAVAVLGVFFASDKKHPWLITFWITYIVFIFTAPFFTSITPFLIFDPIIYTENYVSHFLITYGLWSVLFILILYTVKTKRGFIFKKKDKKEPYRKN